MDDNRYTWHNAGPAQQFGDGTKPVDAGRTKVVVARLEGRLFAFDRHCPHVGGPMLRSECAGAVVTCPLHGWSFDLERQGIEVHGYRPLQTYEVREEAGCLMIRVEK